MQRLALPHAVRTELGYRRLSPRQARWVLAVSGAALAGAVALTLSPLASSNLLPRRERPADVALYQAEVARIRNGEGYYQAAAAELSARGYPTRSVFNWRTPLPMWLLGKLPPAWGKALLGIMALVAIALALAGLAREHSESAAGQSRASMFIPVACAILLIGAVLPTVLGDLFVMPVLWAGVLIALSLGAYGIGRPRLGVAFGLAAVFFRELALPYCLLSAVLAWRARRRQEVWAWLVGLAAWLLLFGLHWWRVRGLIPPDAVAHRHGWLCCGGAAFVISTAQMNAYLLCLPQWATAVYLVAAMLGFAGWNTPWGTRIGLSACLFLTAFAVVGQSFNQYWGAMIAPLLCFGAARILRRQGELSRAAVCAPADIHSAGLPRPG